MTRLIARAVTLAGVLCCATGIAFAQAPAASQAPAAPSTVDQAIEQLRKDTRTDVNTLIGANMQFSSDEAAKFWPLYKEYEQRRKALTDERIAIIKDYAQNFDTMTDAKATELMQRALGLEEKYAAAKRAFLAELAKVLPAKTVARFYQVHTRIDQLIGLSLATGIPLVQ